MRQLLALTLDRTERSRHASRALPPPQGDQFWLERPRPLVTPTVGSRTAVRAALRLVGWTFFALTAYVVVESALTLWTHRTPDKSVGGMVVAGLALVVMPALGFRCARTP